MTQIQCQGLSGLAGATQMVMGDIHTLLPSLENPIVSTLQNLSHLLHDFEGQPKETTEYLPQTSGIFAAQGRWGIERVTLNQNTICS